MGEHLLLRPRYNYRVVELGVGENLRLVIRRVDYDSQNRPLTYSPYAPKMEAANGDALLALLNDVAMALTKPSLIESDFAPVDA